MNRKDNVRQKLASRRERGDTLIEVTIAIAVMGMILGATMMVINSSLLSVMNSVERTSARGMVNSQVELLRYVFDAKNDENKDVAEAIVNLVGNDREKVSDVDTDGDGVSDDRLGVEKRRCSSSNTGFYLEISNDVSKPVSMSQYTSGAKESGQIWNIADTVYATPEPGTGIWIEGVRRGSSSSGVPGYIDFYVKACWTPYGSNEVGQGYIESNVRVFYND